ncbi:hypothetical protein FZC35_01485 [Candidatus Cytomitobacter indipagum]|uniref:S1-like domain-containing protein n=2 Tax=Candidatus Cytomitobacter indipagum TaxID=2601575 RepID=A0A5C0UG97_9PROT|nr:hypothetical protein FZC35_01485 [Candidatus Cytomitobacter indipagum]
MKILLVSDVETKTKVEGELRIIACLSGKIRNNKIRITMGDKVKVNINPRNLQKASKDNGWISGTGTVVFREK